MAEKKKPAAGKSRKIIMLGAASCLGGNIIGCQHGPGAVRKILVPLLKKKKIPFRDLGDVESPVMCVVTNPRAKCLAEIKITDSLLDKKIRAGKMFGGGGKRGRALPLLLGGDHSFNYQFILAAKKKYKRLGLIWFDAHADFNTPETTPSGNVHGMVLAGLSGKVGEKNICIFGVREVDPEERMRLARSKVTLITMEEIRKKGLLKSLHKAVKTVSKNTAGIHLSFDMDVFNPKIAPGTGTPVKRGLGGADLDLLLEFFSNNASLRKYPPVVSADVMELNPLKDKFKRTARLAAKIITGLSTDRTSAKASQPALKLAE